jgi:hypothetical protein
MAGVEQRGGQRQPQQPRQPEQTQPLQGRAAGRESLQGPTTVDRSEPPQSQQESQERQPPLPSVWDVVERRMRLDELKPKGHWVYPDGRIEPPPPEELEREERELNRLSRELREKGTPRDKLVLELGSYGRPRTRGRSQQADFQTFRSMVEAMSDEEIAAEIRRQENITGFAFSPGIGLGEIIFNYQKGKQEQGS